MTGEMVLGNVLEVKWLLTTNGCLLYSVLKHFFDISLLIICFLLILRTAELFLDLGIFYLYPFTAEIVH